MTFSRIAVTISGLLFYFQTLAQPVNDDYANAIDVSSIINSCSADAAYTTVGATPDLNAGSCWNNAGPQLNVWFRFTAPANGIISVTVDVGGAKGSQTGTQVAIWQADGTSQVACQRYRTSRWDAEDVIVQALGLTPGSIYYI